MDQWFVHEFIDVETGEVLCVRLTDAEFVTYLHQTFGGFRMDDEPEERDEYEQELVAARVPSEQFDQETARLYAQSRGHGHPDVCLCPACAPWEYE